MDGKALKEDGNQVFEYVDAFWSSIRQRPVQHQVTPGYLTTSGVLPDAPPEEPENISDVLADVDKHILPGLTLWHHPNFHAYYPTAISYPAILADIICGAFGCIGFTWNASPACTELEIVMMNWLGKMLLLPEEFLNRPGSKGGGIIQGTASEATLVALLAARTRALAAMGGQSEDSLRGRLVCYCSEQAHSCVERAALIGHVKVHKLTTDDKFSLRGETLEKAIKEDRDKGLIPFLVVATIGTTTVCSFDDLQELGGICKKESLWMHIDAAYAGSAAICPEYRYLLNGIELADSFSFNPHKWMMTNFDCSAMWMKDCYEVAAAFNIDMLILRNEFTNDVMDFRHLQIPFGRRFRALKLWFVLRLLGVKRLQENIRKQISLAKEFEKLVRGNPLYEIVGEVTLGLVCFRLKESNEANEKLVKVINDVDRRIHLTPSKAGSKYFLRLAICSSITELPDVEFGWKVIQECSEKVLESSNTEKIEKNDS